MSMGKRDFDILFAAIDTNRSGQVNLVEFGTFLTGGRPSIKPAFNLSSKNLVPMVAVNQVSAMDKV